MKIIKETYLEIDKIDDSVIFELTLFSQGKYDKEQLRTIVRNTGLKLEIGNRLKSTLKINSLDLGIKVNNNFNKMYYSTKVQENLPISLAPREQINLFFYGYDISDKLDDFVGEKAIFIINTEINGSSKIFHSSFFDGDKIEDIIETLEDGESSNWGHKHFVTFDQERRKLPSSNW